MRQSHAVTVISSKPDKQAAIEALGATAAISSVGNAAFLAATIAGAEAAYLMVLPNFAVADSRAYHRRVGHIAQADVRRMVQLSSWVAHLAAGTGGILGSNDVEGILVELPGLALTQLRLTSFYTNMFGFIGMIKVGGTIGVSYPGSTRGAFVHPRDIASAAAEELTTPAAPGLHVRYIASEERTADKVAQVLRAAIGQSALRWVASTDAQVQENLVKNGVPAGRVAEIVDIYASINSGALGEDYEQHKPALGQVKLEDLTKEFAAVF